MERHFILNIVVHALNHHSLTATQPCDPGLMTLPFRISIVLFYRISIHNICISRLLLGSNIMHVKSLIHSHFLVCQRVRKQTEVVVNTDIVI